MSQFLFNYAEFLAKSVTFLIVFALAIAIFASVRSGGQKAKSSKGTLKVRSLNDFYLDLTHSVEQLTLNKSARKAAAKQLKLADKEAEGNDDRQRVFVMDFNGDVHASAVESMRHEITAVLSTAKTGDEAVLRLESPGGYVSPYGLAASQLQRLKRAGITLTICVDEVAASGGYMMACTADKIIAAPFAILGSVGVVAEVPNINRALKKLNVDYDVFTAGESKRTLTLMGENTQAGREKFEQQMTEVHTLFKGHVSANRPQVNITEIATGEVWYGHAALERQLIDEVMTSDEYLSAKAKDSDLIHLDFALPKQSRLKSLISGTAAAVFEHSLPRVLALYKKAS